MNVFISWSGPTSLDVANALRDWLPKVIQSIKPFVSNKDLPGGLPWSDQLFKELGEADCGIACITPANVTKPWLLYEAGALAGKFDRAVFPLLINVEASEFSDRGGPLTRFQTRVCNKDGLRMLVHDLNGRQAREHQLEDELLDATFDRWWDEIAGRLQGTDRLKQDETSTEYTWLLNVRDFARIPDASAAQTFWMITPDIERSTRANSAMYDWDKNQYVFISKNTPQNVDAETTLRNDHPNVRVNCKTPPAEFDVLAATDYIIVMRDRQPTKAYLELPVEDHGLWIKVDASAVSNFVNRFKPLARDAT